MSAPVAVAEDEDGSLEHLDGVANAARGGGVVHVRLLAGGDAPVHLPDHVNKQINKQTNK
eukprot:917363-Prorocentrum_minimum.AAC.1